MKAIISDIHGNLPALEAVLADIKKQSAEVIYCLGDVVGYGPNPRECLELAMTWPVVVRGNHDQGAMVGPENFNRVAEQALLWSRGQIDACVPSPKDAQRRWSFLKACPERLQEGDFLYVHGSARRPVHEYVYPEDVHNEAKMRAIFAYVDRWCFQGHTHVPGIFTESLEFFTPEELSFDYKLGSRKAMINVGSVGQPRDRDCRASYVLLDGETVHFRRVEYDIDATIRKIQATPELPIWLGDRLLGAVKGGRP